MELTYEQVLKYNIYDAIKMKYEETSSTKSLTREEMCERFRNNPTRIPNNPLLSDYNWVYEHAEELFHCMIEYQQYQGVEEYYTLFKAITNKYPIEEDYNKYLYSNNKRDKHNIEYKWHYFAIMLTKFFEYTFDERLDELLKKEDFVNYFLRYPFIYNQEVLKKFGIRGINRFFEYNSICVYYRQNCDKLFDFIKQGLAGGKISLSIMMDKNIIKYFARNPNVEEFYCNLDHISSQISTHSYIEEHKKYCDEQINGVIDGILPCLLDEYQKAEEIPSYPYEVPLTEFKTLKQEVIIRIHKKHKNNPLTKKAFYQELSKYMIVGMFISRNYETDPYNILIDIETLYEFANANNRTLQGYNVYEFLVNYESKDVFEIIEFYQRNKELPLKEMLYEDWQKQCNLFVEEINSSLLKPDELQPETNESGITYYDITNITDLILFHNTSTPIDKPWLVDELIERVKKGKPHCMIKEISLSLQDKEHQEYYKEKNGVSETTIKFVYGRLNPNRVGIVCHEDAYSISANETNIENFNYKNRLYTLKNFMARTTRYNEIVYVIGDELILPLGIICEDEITEVEVEVAKALNILIFYRKKQKITKKSSYKPKKLIKSYRHRFEPPHRGFVE